MLFVIATTSTAGLQLSSGKFVKQLVEGFQDGNYAATLHGGLNLFFTLFILGAALLIVSEAAMRWFRSISR
jgi:hypothetical protein